MVPPGVDVRLAVRDVVKVPAASVGEFGSRSFELACDFDGTATGKSGNRTTHSLSGLSTIVVESLKYSPAVPSVRLYAVPYLCV